MDGRTDQSQISDHLSDRIEGILGVGLECEWTWKSPAVRRESSWIVSKGGGLDQLAVGIPPSPLQRYADPGQIHFAINLTAWDPLLEADDVLAAQ